MKKFTVHSIDFSFSAYVRKGLSSIQKNIKQNIPGVKVNFLEEQLKIQIYKGGAVVKIEVNQEIRGVMDNLNELILCERAQEDFDDLYFKKENINLNRIVFTEINVNTLEKFQIPSFSATLIRNKLI